MDSSKWSQRRRLIATLIGIVGLAVVGSYMAAAWPRNVVVRYEFPPRTSRLDVDYTLEGEAMVSTRFVTEAHPIGFLRHELKLQPGSYEAHITLYSDSGTAVTRILPLIVPSDGELRFDLTRQTTR